MELPQELQDLIYDFCVPVCSPTPTLSLTCWSRCPCAASPLLATCRESRLFVLQKIVITHELKITPTFPKRDLILGWLGSVDPKMLIQMQRLHIRSQRDVEGCLHHLKLVASCDLGKAGEVKVEIRNITPGPRDRMEAERVRTLGDLNAVVDSLPTVNGRPVLTKDALPAMIEAMGWVPKIRRCGTRAHGSCEDNGSSENVCLFGPRARFCSRCGNQARVSLETRPEQ
jgi:hypothetical protein